MSLKQIEQLYKTCEKPRGRKRKSQKSEGFLTDSVCRKERSYKGLLYEWKARVKTGIASLEKYLNWLEKKGWTPLRILKYRWKVPDEKGEDSQPQFIVIARKAKAPFAF